MSRRTVTQRVLGGGIAAALVAALAVGAWTGEGEVPLRAAAGGDAHDLGSCPAGVGHVDRASLAGILLDPAIRWVEVSALEVTDEDGPSRSDGELDVLLTTGGGSEPAKLFERSVPRARLALDRGHRLLAGVSGPGGSIGPLVAVDGGSVAFVGECADDLTRAFASFTASSGAADPLALLQGVMAGRAEDVAALETFSHGTPPVAWIDRAPGDRQFDPDETPPDVVERALVVSVEITVPAAWRDDDHLALCTKTSLAWGDCSDLDAPQPGHPIVIEAYMLEPEPMEIWFRNPDEAPSPVLGRAAVIGPPAVADALESGQSIALAPRFPTEDARDALRRAAAAEPVLRTT